MFLAMGVITCGLASALSEEVWINYGHSAR
jgi:hypothetical protein